MMSKFIQLDLPFYYIPAEESVISHPDIPKSDNKKDGCFCEKCKDFFKLAEPNQDNNTFICYSCK